MLAGIRYEKAVLARLKGLHERTTDHPWIVYKAAGGSGICQPDGLVWLTNNHLLVVEVKLSWVRAAREKLIHFYGPLVQLIHPEVTLSYLQIYKNGKRGSHKKPVSIFALDTIQKGKYKECQTLL